MDIGIIGFGRFGKLITRHLSEDNKVYVHSRSGKNDEIKKANGIPATLEEVCKKDIIIPCVPISKFEYILKKIKNLLKSCTMRRYAITPAIITVFPPPVTTLSNKSFFPRTSNA